MRSSRSVRAAGAVALAVVCPSCAPGLMKLPSASGPPASDAAAIVRQLSTTCSGLEALTAEISVSGSIQGRRFRARLLAGVTSDAARLEAVAPVGQPFFIFVARGDDSTLLLPRDNRILAHGQPRDVMEAIAGVALTPRELQEALTGCDPLEGSPTDLGPDWRTFSGTAKTIYVHRAERGAWQVVAVVHSADDSRKGWRAEYRGFQNEMATSVRLISNEPNRFNLGLTLSQVERRAKLGAEAFQVQTPRGAESITLEELKRSGPFGP